jgi:hypothetical protein
VRDIEVIATGLGLEAGRAVGRDAVAKPAIGATEVSDAAGLLRELLVAPDSLDQDAHWGRLPFTEARGHIAKLLDIL